MNDDIDYTVLLNKAQTGDREAIDSFYDEFHGALREIASRMMWKEKAGHTLQPTALVNEAMVRFIEQGLMEKAENRRFLFASASRLMRQVLVDHARGRNAGKRSAEGERIPFEVILDTLRDQHGVGIIDLDHALNELKEKGGSFVRQAEIVEMRFFGGFSEPEIAEGLDISVPTVQRDWAKARAWLKLNLEGSNTTSE